MMNREAERLRQHSTINFKSRSRVFRCCGVVAFVVVVATAESAAVAVGSVGGSVGGGRYFRCYFYFFDKGGGV